MKKIWNNRIFRTFLQTTISTIVTFFTINNIFEIDDKALISLIISAIATGLSAIMPLFNEEDK